jgi:hypothetical protein
MSYELEDIDADRAPLNCSSTPHEPPLTTSLCLWTESSLVYEQSHGRWVDALALDALATIKAVLEVGEGWKKHVGVGAPRAGLVGYDGEHPL